jgi:hypothetical protein
MNSTKLFTPEAQLLEAMDVVSFVGGQINYIEFLKQVSKLVLYLFLLVLGKFVVTSRFAIGDKFKSRSVGVFNW